MEPDTPKTNLRTKFTDAVGTFTDKYIPSFLQENWGLAVIGLGGVGVLTIGLGTLGFSESFSWDAAWAALKFLAQQESLSAPNP